VIVGHGREEVKVRGEPQVMAWNQLRYIGNKFQTKYGLNFRLLGHFYYHTHTPLYPELDCQLGHQFFMNVALYMKVLCTESGKIVTLKEVTLH